MAVWALVLRICQACKRQKSQGCPRGSQKKPELRKSDHLTGNVEGTLSTTLSTALVSISLSLNSKEVESKDLEDESCDQSFEATDSALFLTPSV